MVATRRLPADDGVLVLGDADAAEMLALATLTQPGPFLARTHTMGRFVGLRVNGRLAAMAGERMRFPGMPRSAVSAPIPTSAASAWRGDCRPP